MIMSHPSTTTMPSATTTSVGGTTTTSLAMPPQPAQPTAAAEVPKFRPRACARCSMSKLKCNWLSEPGEAPCERCARSKSECVLPSLKPRGPRRGNPTRVGQLEQKIDGIMSLLTASKHVQQANARAWAAQALSGDATTESKESLLLGPSSSSSPQPQPSPDPTPQPYGASTSAAATATAQVGTPGTPGTSTTSASMSRDHSVTTTSQPHPQQAPPPPSSSLSSQHTPPSLQQQQAQAQAQAQAHAQAHAQAQAQAQQPQLSPLPMMRVPPLEHIEVSPGMKITFHDAELAFDEYRTLYSPYFPFVPLPYGISAYDMYQREPLLFRVLVQSVLPMTAQEQRSAKRWFREQIAHHIVVEEEKSVGLLQAILLHFAWCDFGYYVRPKTMPLLQLAIGLVVDLGLHRSPRALLHAAGSFLADATTAMGGSGLKPDRTLQDMRAALGCFYVSSLSSSLFRQTLSLPFNGYLQQCCDTLLESHEFESDRFLVAIVRMQQLTQRIAAVLPNPDNSERTVRMHDEALDMAIASIRKELDAVVQNQPPEVKNNYFLWTHYHNVMVRLYEPMIYRRPLSGHVDPANASRRTDSLWTCLQALKDFFHSFLSIPPAVASVLPFMSQAHLSFGFVTLMRLHALEDPEWDAEVARRSVDFLPLSQQLEDHFKATEDFQDTYNAPADMRRLGRRKRYAVEDGRTYLTMYREKMRWIRYWYSMRLPPYSQQQQQQQQQQAHQQQPLPRPPADGISGNMMDLDPVENSADDLSSAFWKSIFDLDGPWEVPMPPMSQGSLATGPPLSQSVGQSSRQSSQSADQPPTQQSQRPWESVASY